MKTIRDLTKTHCTPSKTGGKALTASQLKEYLAVVPHWILAADGKVLRFYCKVIHFVKGTCHEG